MIIIPYEMKSNPLFILLSSFAPQEIQRFQVFLQSPYYNNNPKISQLYAIVRPYLHSRNKKVPTPTLLWQAIYKNTTFSATRFNKLIFELNRLALKFVQTCTYANSACLHKIMLLQGLNKRKMG
jgi:hypothetical protein